MVDSQIILRDADAPGTLQYYSTLVFMLTLSNSKSVEKCAFEYLVYSSFVRILGAAASALSSGSPGHLSVGSHTSEDLLLGSLQSTLGPSKSSWEPSSLSATDQRRTSSKTHLVE